MASLTSVIEELKKNGQLPDDATPSSLTDEQWDLVSARMRELQEISFNEGNRSGIMPGETPSTQARKDRENPNLGDPLRDSRSSKNPENKE